MQEISTPLISIVVPVYNVEKYLNRCVDSILSQSYGNIEVILVDDGSPDRCPEICDNYAQLDGRVKVVHQLNAGLSAARNAGIDSASGELIGFVDGDDWVSGDMYEVLCTGLVNSGANMSICNFRYVNGDEADDCDNSNLPIKDEVLIGTERIIGKLSDEKNWYWVIACNKLFRREMFSDTRYPLGKLHEDEFVIHKLLLKCDKVACVSRALYFYLQHSSGITKSKYTIRRLDSAEAHFDRTEVFLSRGINARDAYFACSIGLRVMSNSYMQLSFKDPQYRSRYDELSGQYREVAKKLLKTQLPLFVKARLIANCISPYFTWKIIEHALRRING